jgi:uncharacterized protein (DUF2164 family)
MEIRLNKEIEQTLITSIRRYVAENMETEIGNLQGSLFLQYCLDEIGPHIYNAAIVDAQRHLQARLADLDSECYLPETSYWSKQTRKAAKK